MFRALAVSYRADRLGTIDLPCRRRASGGVLRFSRLLVLRVTWAYCAPIDWGQSIYESIKQVALPIASICQGTQASARSFTFVSAFRSGISVASSTRFSIE